MYVCMYPKEVNRLALSIHTYIQASLADKIRDAFEDDEDDDDEGEGEGEGGP